MKKHWVLLRGLGRDKRHWGAFLTEFEQAFPNDQISVLDTCGNGEFTDLTSPLSISEYTDHCRNQLHAQASKQSRNVSLVALSLGGMVAMDWAQRYPMEVRSLTLINTSAANLTPWFRRIKFPALAKLFWASVFNRSPEQFEQAIMFVSSNYNFEQNKEVLASWVKYRKERHVSISNLIRQLIAASRFKASKIIAIKPLVLSSQHDRLVSCEASRDIHHHFGGHMVVHNEAGHDLSLDAGQWLIKQIQRHCYL